MCWSYVVIFLIASYLIGAIPNVYIWVRLITGKDIRKIGSTNVGGLNAFRNVSKLAGAIGGLLDIGKGILVAWLATTYFKNPWVTAAACFLVVVGHDWPVFLKFKGGKGVGASVGTLFVLTYPYMVGVGAYLFGVALGALTVKDALVGSIIGFWLVPLALGIFYRSVPLAALGIGLAIVGTIRFSGDFKRFLDRRKSSRTCQSREGVGQNAKQGKDRNGQHM